MKLVSRLLISLVVVLLSGCVVAPIPIDNLTYKGAAQVKTDRTARIAIVSSGAGDSTSTYLMPAGGALIPMTKKSGESPFGTQEQQGFAQSLAKELVRLGIVKSTTSDASQVTDMVVAIHIDRAMRSGDIVEYKLDMTMDITGAKTPFQRKYKVVSSEKDSLWVKMNTNGAQAREKLVHLMLERLIPDIEAYALAVARP